MLNIDEEGQEGSWEGAALVTSLDDVTAVAVIYVGTYFILKITPPKNAATPECLINSDLPHTLTNTTNINTFQAAVILKIFKKNVLEIVGTLTPIKTIEMSTHSHLTTIENTLKNMNSFFQQLEVS